MRNFTPPPPPLNELANWLVAGSCLTAIAALPLVGMSALSGQNTVEADLTRVVQSVYEERALYPLPPRVAGTLMRQANSRLSEDAAGREDECVFWCEIGSVAAGVMWHRAFEDAWWPEAPWAPTWRYRLGHGLHSYWMQGYCFPSHTTCWLFPDDDTIHALSVSEFTRRISGAVAARDVAALAGYANLPAVSLFAKRSAIQLHGCDGKTVVAHIPVNPELLAAIEVATAQLDSEG